MAAKQGFEVTIAEQTDEWGGRVHAETQLPGLAPWRRVRDYRIWALTQMGNVSMYTNSELDADAALNLGTDHIAIATGARWSKRLYSALEIPSESLDASGIYPRRRFRGGRFR